MRERRRRKMHLGLACVLLLSARLGALAAQDLCLCLGLPVWTNNQVQFVLTGELGVAYVIESSADLQNWAPVLTNSDYGIMRVITLDPQAGAAFYRAKRGWLPLFAGALIAQQAITNGGN